MILTGHQPEYLPYIGFFNKIMHADKFVLVDHIQFNKKNWQNRNKIRTVNGWVWLTVPVYSKNKFTQSINEVEINNTGRWKDKHWKTIYLNYKKAPYFNDFADFFKNIYARSWIKLVNLNEEIIRYLFTVLKINIKIYKSSELNVEGKKTDLVIDLCKKLNADAYLSGEGAKEYINESTFRETGLKSYFRKMEHPIYKQQFESFEPYISVIDLLFNCGAKKSSKIIYDCGKIILQRRY